MVFQIHYAHPLPAPDTSGVELMVSERAQKYQAGIYLLLDGSTVIPPNTPGETTGGGGLVTGEEGEGEDAGG